MHASHDDVGGGIQMMEVHDYLSFFFFFFISHAFLLFFSVSELAGLEHGAIHGPLLRVELVPAQSVVAACPSHSHYELSCIGVRLA